jgi:hypothetical protein
MIVSNPSVFVPEAPEIDITETRWASEYLSLMIEQLGPDSPVSMVLAQARRELLSLSQSADTQTKRTLRIAA